MNKFLDICEDELDKSNCCLIHFGCCLVSEDGEILGKGHNFSSVKECRVKCLKSQIKNKEIGKNPAVCYAIHGEWMTLMKAIDKHGLKKLKNSTLYIIGRYPDGKLWKSKFFACTICSRLLKFCGIKEIIGLQFNESKKLSMEEAFVNSFQHILGESS